MADFLGGKFKIMITIKGLTLKDDCLFNVSQDMGFLSTINYDCEVSPQQLNEIYQAMLDRSEEPVTETFTTYTEIEDSNGNISQNPTETTMTDSKFNVI